MTWAEAAACLAFLSGFGLVVAGTYVLSGLGWSLLAGAAGCFLAGIVILRGARGG